MRRIFSSLVGVSLVAGATSVGAADAPVVSGGSPAVQLVAGSRGVVTRVPGRPLVRRYRSYSIEPGATAAGSAVVPGVVETAPSFVPSTPMPSRPSSKPSFMRGDAKARGQFHR